MSEEERRYDAGRLREERDALLAALIAEVEAHNCWDAPCDSPVCITSRQAIAGATGLPFGQRPQERQ